MSSMTKEIVYKIRNRWIKNRTFPIGFFEDFYKLLRYIDRLYAKYRNNVGKIKLMRKYIRDLKGEISSLRAKEKKWIIQIG